MTRRAPVSSSQDEGSHAPTSLRRASRAARLLLVSAATLGMGMMVTMGCESSGSYGTKTVSRCVPEGACGEAMFEPGLVAARGDAGRGQALWAEHCASCHGEAGVGVQDARHIDMTSAAWHARFGDGQIATATRVGRPPVMPAFRFTDDEIRDLLAHIRSLRREGATAPPTPPPSTSPGY